MYSINLLYYLQSPRWVSRGWDLVCTPNGSWCNTAALAPFLTTSTYIGLSGGALLSNSMPRFTE